MTKTIASPEKKKVISDVLLKRILKLSQDTTPMKFSKVTATETIEMSLKRKAEYNFQRALATRVWWQLSPKEQLIIRKRALEGSFSGFDVEYDCTKEVQEVIATFCTS